MIHVIAVITAHPGKRQSILDEIRPRLATVLTEEGCVEYTVTIDADVVGAMHTQTRFGPDTIVIIEKWASLKHLEAHSTAPYIPEYFAAVDPLTASRVVHFLSSAV
jgi:quinol monooxygenase YgiN